MTIVREPLEHAYYDGVRFLIDVTTNSGDKVPLIDGGAFDWVAKIASNRKLTYVASALGTQLVAFMFRRRQASIRR